MIIAKRKKSFLFLFFSQICLVCLLLSNLNLWFCPQFVFIARTFSVAGEYWTNEEDSWLVNLVIIRSFNLREGIPLMNWSIFHDLPVFSHMNVFILCSLMIELRIWIYIHWYSANFTLRFIHHKEQKVKQKTSVINIAFQNLLVTNQKLLYKFLKVVPMIVQNCIIISYNFPVLNLYDSFILIFISVTIQFLWFLFLV